MIKAVILLLMFLSVRVWAFPEMVRHGYVHCNSCHAALPGTGLLNEYGRQLSKDLLSQKTLNGHAPGEGDEKFAWDLLQTPSWLLLQSDIRLLQTFKEDDQVSTARFLVMQVDVDASAQAGDHFRFFGSLGRIARPGNTDPTAKDFVISARHGVEAILTKPDAVNRIAARVGRFMPAYGIAFAEHTFVTRRLLDFTPGQERYAYDVSWNDDRRSVIATGIMSRAEGSGFIPEQGGAIQIATGIGEKSKLGINYFQAQRQEDIAWTRRIYGAFAHVAFDNDWYALIEVDQPQRKDLKWGFLDTVKLGYEIQQGLHLVAVHEFANLNKDQADPRFEAYSIGAEWFPRPHWDLYGLYRKERDTSQSDQFSDVVWLIAHFYL